jgi:hypothetical protein
VSTLPEEEIKEATKAQMLHLIDSPLRKLFAHFHVLSTVVSPLAGSGTPLGYSQVVTTDNGLTILLVVRV